MVDVDVATVTTQDLGEEETRERQLNEHVLVDRLRQATSSSYHQEQAHVILKIYNNSLIKPQYRYSRTSEISRLGDHLS